MEEEAELLEISSSLLRRYENNHRALSFDTYAKYTNKFCQIIERYFPNETELTFKFTLNARQNY